MTRTMPLPAGMRALHDFTGARDAAAPQDRLREVLRRAQGLRERMLDEPEVLCWRSFDLICAPYPTYYAFSGVFADRGFKFPLVHLLNRLFVLQYLDHEDLLRHHRLIDINLKGLINGCHTAFALLKDTSNSRVINMCSASALYGQPELGTYSATKAAVRSLTEALNIEWRRHGIEVVDVLPLFVNTAMVANEVSRMKTVSTLGVRLGPQDVAATVWRLATARGRLPVHSLVGWQTRLFATLSKFSPDFMNRLVTAWMAGH